MPNGPRAGWRVSQRRGQGSGNAALTDILLAPASALVVPLPKFRPFSYTLISRIGMIQNIFCLRSAISEQGFAIFFMFVCNDRSRKQRCIDGARAPNGKRAK